MNATPAHPVLVEVALRQALHEAVDAALDVEEDFPVLVAVCRAIGVPVSSVVERAEELARTTPGGISGGRSGPAPCA